MTQAEIAKFLNDHEPNRQRTIAIVDFGNVEKWKNGLGWEVGIQELARLVKSFSYGDPLLRRFYYGSDYGSDESSTAMVRWSWEILNRAKMNLFHICTKRVKYIHCDNKYGFEKKCDLDVEMAVDLIRERNNYDTIILMSGDGDLVYALEYLNKAYAKKSIVIGARGHIGREIVDAQKAGIINDVLYADDFKYRLDKSRFMHR